MRIQSGVRGLGAGLVPDGDGWRSSIGSTAGSGSKEGSQMFGLRSDKVEWFLGLLLITAMALAAFA